MLGPSTSSLSGKELKVVIAHLPTTTMIFRNDTGHVIGFGGSLYYELEWIAKKLCFSIAMEVSKENSFGILTNGTWTGMRGQLQRGDVDLACAPFTGSSDYGTMELAAYLLGDEFGILGKYPTPKSSIYGIFEMFSIKVWMTWIASIIAAASCMSLIIGLIGKLFNSNSTFNSFKIIGDTFLFVFGTIFNQGGQYRRNSYRSVGIIAITWCLVSFVFVNIYCSCLTSYTSLTFQRPDITTFKDLATNSLYQVVTIKSTIPEHIFLGAKSGTMKEIGNKLRLCGDQCSLTNYDQIVEKKVLAGNHVAILPISACDRYVLKTTLNPQHQCRLTIGQETIAFQNMYMGVPKNSPYVKELNQESLWWLSFGFKIYWKKRLSPRTKQCQLDYNSDGESVKVVGLVPLKLEQFYLAFLVLFIGYVLSLFSFIIERLLANNAQRRSQNQLTQPQRNIET